MKEYIKPKIYTIYGVSRGIIPLAGVGAAVGAALATEVVGSALLAGLSAGMAAGAAAGSRDNMLVQDRSLVLQKI
ncbi:hypothetical protein [Megasphaera stantonii]|uniref:hypothetical protein n=1 Tax=Megasphaera stantonii TaxID=2144175 RepID=UPI0032087974